CMITTIGVQAQQQDTTQADLRIIPFVIYQPETSVAFGGVLSLTFSTSLFDKRRSNVLAGLQYTLHNQYVAFSIYSLYISQEKYFAQGRIEFNFFPDRYYGTGANASDNFEEVAYNTFLFDNSLYQRVYRSLYLGVRTRFVDRYNMELEENSLLERENTPGQSGYVTSGIGPSLLVDSRDNLLSTYQGWYVDLNMMFHADSWGNEYPFNQLRLDARKFVPLAREQVLAFQYLGLFTSNGAAPFKELAELGGDQIMRGYFTGRYRDDVLMAAQIEYRRPLFGRFGGVAFAGVGNVADRVASFFDTSLKETAGVGLRFTLNKKERVKLRFDTAVGSDGLALYFGINEA
ncbi:MAG: BamA/TamA family outer membrane protein, partial [Bacteroidota bacterium]